ncbi:MAG: YebC/PmpR family DNA-binding transcriptional regulator [bacterium]|nr:YebC/PmpR family DNA-binding transcriptional regulator [bacterium]
MSGHSKWSTIKHKKAANDAKRGAAFNKIIRELVVAAREGGADPKNNAALESVMVKARSAAMPKDTIERAILRGAGGGGGENYERLTYEGRGPGGVAMIVTTLTDNKNRTVADLRHAFSKNGGQLAENGSVSWMFERKAQVLVKAAGGDMLDADELLEACAEAGAEDFKLDGEGAEILADPVDLVQVRQWFTDNAKYEVQESDLAMIPKETVEITAADEAKRILRLLDTLEDHDDVQNVYSNWSMSDELIEQVA